MGMATVSPGGGLEICLVEDVAEGETDKLIEEIVNWAWDAEGIRVARPVGGEGAGLLVDFVGDPLRGDELPRLAGVLGNLLHLLLSTVVLLITGLIGLLAYAWRKRKCVPS